MITRRVFLQMMGGMLAAGEAAMLAGCAEDGGRPALGDTAGNPAPPQVTAGTPISDVVGHPLFEGYGRLLFPTTYCEPTPEMTLADLPQCLPWYSEVHVETTLDIVNWLLARRAAGQAVFHPIYSEQERAADPDLADTGLFHFQPEGLAQGDRAPLVLWCAGGGFAYVAAMHDSFPHALSFARAGVHGFALIYRPDAQLACEDLARAVSYIFEHADELGVDTRGYALGGGSAGARMAAWVGGYGPAAFGGEPAVPRPAAVLMQYTGLRETTGDDPATYACVGTNDGIASWQTMQARLKELDSTGVPTEFHAYEGAEARLRPGRGHGGARLD